jgi:dihydrofolate synthase / folylpolyglutamate synthase
MNYTETIDYLYSKLPVFEKVGQSALKPGLQNILLLCEALGNPHKKFKSIHVAGTNGKGSTSHLLASVLIASGYKTGLHTSPHLKSFTERLKINGQPAPEQEIVDFVEKHQNLIEKVKPSFFEISVAMAFDYFARQQVEIAVIEVGLGGRLDSTNIILPILSVITNIGLDHVAILGDTLQKIATEKAGIIKTSVPVVISENQPEISNVFIDKAKACQSVIYFASNNFKIKQISIEKSRRVVDVFKGKSLKYQNLKIDLLGEYQLKNLAGVLQGIEILNQLGFEINEYYLRVAFENCCNITNFKGRWTQLKENPIVIADVAHNFEGLTESINQINKYQYQNLNFVLGFVRDKDVRKILTLFPTLANYYFCQTNTPRALPAIELVEIAKEFNIHGKLFTDVNEAFEAALENSNSNDFIYVGGSTFVVSELAEI